MPGLRTPVCEDGFGYLEFSRHREKGNHGLSTVYRRFFYILSNQQVTLDKAKPEQERSIGQSCLLQVAGETRQVEGIFEGIYGQ